MIKPKLILLSNSFPLGHGEEFLETEILFLAERFDVDIVPTDFTSSNFSHLRPVPSNVHVREDIFHRIIDRTKHWKRWLAQNPRAIAVVFRLLIQEFSKVPLNKNTFREFLKYPITAVLLESVLKQAYSFHSISLLYSYWLNDRALAIALLKSTNRQLTTVSRTHRWDLYAHGRPDHYQPYQEQIIKRLDHIICISNHGKKYLKKLYPWQAEKISISRLGVQSPKNLSHPSQNGRLHIITCSYLVPVKRTALLIQALSKCTILIKWTHLGGGEIEETLKSEAFKLPNNIQWCFTGLISNREVHAFYRTEPVDLFINVSSSEGLPVSIMEAMSYGVPVAATNVGGTSELVNHETGYLWTEQVAPMQIADTLKSFFELPNQQKKQLRANAVNMWDKKVNAEKQYVGFVDWLLNISAK